VIDAFGAEGESVCRIGEILSGEPGILIVN
jgi:hypothetical protein